MRYISLFSGVEAATLAWEPFGWEPVAFAEIEPFPSAVLAHRWPDVPNLGDVTKVDWSKYRGTVDLVVGGSPCQAFSVAGKREGLMDERGQLMLEYVRAVREVEPRWSFGKTSPEFCRRTGDEPLAPSSGRWMNSGMGWHGEFWTLNSSEWPSDAAVSFLSDVLEGGAERLRRYSLSPKACQGILRRASKRGKPLPPMLEAALRAQGMV